MLRILPLPPSPRPPDQHVRTSLTLKSNNIDYNAAIIAKNTTNGSKITAELLRNIKLFVRPKSREKIWWLFSFKERAKGRFLKKTIICVSQKLSTFAENKLASDGRKSLKQKKKKNTKARKGRGRIFWSFLFLFFPPTIEES